MLLAWNRDGGVPKRNLVEIQKSGQLVMRMQDILGTLAVGTPYQISLSVTTNVGNSAKSLIRVCVNDLTGAHPPRGFEVPIDWTPADLASRVFTLGRSSGNDNDASATYDEVRVWNGALTLAQLRKSALCNTDYPIGSLTVETDAAEFDNDVGLVAPVHGYNGGIASNTVVSCSAQTIAAGTAGYGGATCSGYTLYICTNGVETVVQEGTDTVFNFTHLGYGYRLVWHWTEPYYARVTADPLEGGTAAVASATEFDTYLLGTTVTVNATPAQGQVFVGWRGEVPASCDPHDASLTFTFDRPYAMEAVFKPEGSTITTHWIGGANGDWNVQANWSPVIDPRIADLFVLGSGSAFCTGPLGVHALVVSNATLEVAGADLANISFSVAGDLTIGDGGLVKVTAGRAADPQTFALLYPQANPMTIGGKFTIEKGGKFTPVTDILTGNPVFVTARVFDLQDEGMVDATGMGYGVALLDGECPEGARSYTAAGYTYYLYAPGCYPGYGTSAGAYGISLGRGGTAYGYAYAPWLPGSPGGIYNGYFNGYNWQTGTYEQHPEYLMFLNGGWGRGGGAIRIHATDRMRLAGAVVNDGLYRFYNTSSGGGTWLTAGSIEILTSTKFMANGKPNRYEGSSGGRISLGAGLTDAQIADLAAGTDPADLALTNGNDLAFMDAHTYKAWDSVSMALTSVPVEGGSRTWTMNPAAAVFVAVTGTGAEGAAMLDGTVFAALAGGQVTITAEQLKPAAFSRSQATVTGWSVTNRLGEVVASGTGATATFIPPANQAIFGLVWDVAAIETETDPVVPAPDGVARTFVGTVDNRWSTPENWSPAGVPAGNDDVTLTDVDVDATGPLAVKSLTLNGTARLTVHALPAKPVHWEYSIAALYGQATEVVITEALTLNDTSVIVPDSDYVTGASVHFKAGSVMIAEGARFDAVQRGFGWTHGWGDVPMLPLWRGRIEPLMYTPATRQPITYAFGAAECRDAGTRRLNPRSVIRLWHLWRRRRTHRARDRRERCRKGRACAWRDARIPHV